MSKHQHDLEQTCDPGGGFKVAEVGLDRTKGDWGLCDFDRLENTRQGIDFNRIAQRSSGSVRLNVAECRRLNVRA